MAIDVWHLFFWRMNGKKGLQSSACFLSSYFLLCQFSGEICIKAGSTHMTLQATVFYAVLHFIVHCLCYLIDITIVQTLMVLVVDILGRWVRALTPFPSKTAKAKIESLETARGIKSNALRCVAKSAQRVQELWGVAVEEFHGSDGTLRQRYDSPLYNRHVGTILGFVRPELKAVKYDFREKVTGSDGCELYIDWLFYKGDPTSRAAGCVLVLPGLASHSASGYIMNFVKHASSVEACMHCGVLNARGMGTTPLTQPKLMSGSMTDDIRYVVEHYFTEDRVSSRFGRRLPLMLVGFSLGSNILVKYLGEEGQRLATSPTNAFPVKCAVAICTPWDPHETTQIMNRPLEHLLYQLDLLDGLMRYIRRHHHHGRRFRGINVDEILMHPPRSIEEFDTRVTAPHYGFSSSEEYYTECMSFPKLDFVPVPLLCFMAEDDPVCGPPPSTKKWVEKVKLNNNVTCVIAPAGGHMGFLQSPLAEVNGRPNFLERFVVGALDHAASVLSRS